MILKHEELERRVEEIFAKLSRRQKTALLHGVSSMSFGKLPEFGLEEYFCADGPQGIRLEDGRKTTALPSGIALAATWDPHEAEEFGGVIAREAIANDIRVSLGPGMNLMRTPLNGRNFEYYGEDPVLAGKIAAGYVRGCQKLGVAATPKHMALNNQEISRKHGSSEISWKALRELYLQSFEIVIREAHPWMIMSSYNRINGIFASQYAETQRRFAKEECGFDGVMISDWGGIHAAGDALRGGSDLEMGGSPKNWMGAPLAAELECGLTAEEELTDSVKRVLRLLLRLAFAPVVKEPMEQLRPRHAETAARIAVAGAVLLKNDGNFLPVCPRNTGRILVCGPGADFKHCMGSLEFCGGSGAVHPEYEITPLEAMIEKWGKQCEIRYAPGVRFAESLLFPDHWIQSGSIEYFSSPEEMTQGKMPFRNAECRTLQFSWRKGETASQEDDTEFLDSPFAFRVRIRFQTEEKQTLFPEVRSSRGVKVTEFTIDGKAPAGFSAVPGVQHTLILSGTRVPNNGGSLYVLLPENDPERLVQQALAEAAAADCVIYVGGSYHRFDKEGLGTGDVADADIPQYALCDRQSEFLCRLAEVNPRTAVVLYGGSALEVEPWIGKIPGLLEFWYPGQEGGRAVTDVLDGSCYPGGRLPFTWGKKLGDYACHANGCYPGDRKSLIPRMRYEEGIFTGYRHFDRAGIAPRFPFGFGLGYTEMEYSPMQLQCSGKLSDRSLRIQLSGKVRNTGKHPGCAVLQLYVANPECRGEKRPLRELRNFVKLELEPAEEREYAMELSWRDFAYVSETTGGLVAEPNCFLLQLGTSVADIIQQKKLQLSVSKVL